MSMAPRNNNTTTRSEKMKKKGTGNREQGSGRKELFDSFKGRKSVEVNIELDHVINPYSTLDYFDKFPPAECLIVGMKVKYIPCEYPEKVRVRNACQEEREEVRKRLYDQWDKEEAARKLKRHDAAVKANATRKAMKKGGAK